MEEKVFEKAEEYVMNSDSRILFKAFIGGELDEPISYTEIVDAKEYQMINIMIVLIDTLKELAEEYPDLYKVAKKSKTTSETYTKIETVK